MSLKIHLSIIQPAGYIHSQGFLDQARYARYQFRRLGAQVTVGKNRLREDSVNIIFGAHLGFDAALKQRYTCVFFNLEQLGEGGARVSQSYLDLLRTSAAIDYDERNLAAYGCKSGSVPIVSFQSAPYLPKGDLVPLKDRPIDLLFFGSMNDRRRAIFSRIESCGWSVSTFDHPVYGEERDQFIRQAKAVFNCHFYETSRFEQARAFHTLSLGTPVISERTARTTPPAAFEDAVTWLSDDQLESFFKEEFLSVQWLDRAQEQLNYFERTDALPAWRIVHEYCLGLFRMRAIRIPKPWRPAQMCLDSGSGQYYQLGWLNVNAEPGSFADLSLDLSQALDLPMRLASVGGGRIGLADAQMDRIRIRDEVPQMRNPREVMRNLLRLLKPEGRLEVMIPLHALPDLAADATRTLTRGDIPRALALDRYWDHGSLEHRLEITGYDFVDDDASPCAAESASSILLVMQKIETTLRERTIARMYLPDFGAPEDEGPLTPETAATSNITALERLKVNG
ncbi:MAG: hypothetical protein RLZZ153_241 [Pseudomonadota bacterium]